LTAAFFGAVTFFAAVAFFAAGFFAAVAVRADFLAAGFFAAGFAAAFAGALAAFLAVFFAGLVVVAILILLCDWRPVTGMMRLGYAHYMLGVKGFYASTLSRHEDIGRETRRATPDTRRERTSPRAAHAFAMRRQKPIG